jgi:hypothetical protein
VLLLAGQIALNFGAALLIGATQGNQRWIATALGVAAASPPEAGSGSRLFRSVV